MVNNPLAGLIALGGTPQQQPQQGQRQQQGQSGDISSLGSLVSLLMGRLQPQQQAQQQQSAQLGRPGMTSFGQLMGSSSGGAESVPGFGPNSAYGGGGYMVNNVPGFNPGDPAQPMVVSGSYIGPPVANQAQGPIAYPSGEQVQSTFRPTSQDDD